MRVDSGLLDLGGCQAATNREPPGSINLKVDPCSGDEVVPASFIRPRVQRICLAVWCRRRRRPSVQPGCRRIGPPRRQPAAQPRNGQGSVLTLPHVAQCLQIPAARRSCTGPRWQDAPPRPGAWVLRCSAAARNRSPGTSVGACRLENLSCLHQIWRAGTATQAPGRVRPSSGSTTNNSSSSARLTVWSRRPRVRSDGWWVGRSRLQRLPGSPWRRTGLSGCTRGRVGADA